MVDGARLALEQDHARIGSYRVVLKALNDATAAQGEWDPGQTSVNAVQAAADPTTIGYIGDLDSGASAVSIPILNRPGIPQISPRSSAVGLTSGGAGRGPGEPAKYYPTHMRTFARVVPSDAVQAAVQVTLQQSAGCTKTYVLDDSEVDGEDLATSFGLAAQQLGSARARHPAVRPPRDELRAARPDDRHERRRLRASSARSAAQTPSP